MTDHITALIARYFNSLGGELCVGGVAASNIAAKYGTPLFIYDAQTMEQKWLLLRQALPPEFSIYYSIKANPQKKLLELFLAKGCGLEVASGGELFRALNAGCSPENILFAGPGKTEAELEFALAQNIGEIHVESHVEVQRLTALSRRLRKRVCVAVRVNPTGEVQGGAMRMGGKSAPFGVDEEELGALLDLMSAEPMLELRGIHLFTGTQILDHSLLVSQYQKGVDIARRVAKRMQRPLHTVDFGGGLGIPYFANEQELDIGRLSEGLAAMMAEVRRDRFFSGTRFVVEPGRYLVGESGVYVARVNDIKISRGKKFLILDGGMNHHLAASGNLGQVIKKNFPLTVINRLDREEKEVVDIVGPLCTPLDTLARDVKVPVARIGDFVGIFQSGAYGRSASPIGFLSHLTPAEVWVSKGDVSLICRRGEYGDFFRDLPST